MLVAFSVGLLGLCIAMGQERARQTFRIAELNCENLFDTIHDEGFDDHEFLPAATRRWDSFRYNRKLQMISKELVSISPTTPPDVIVLIEIENDSVVRDLTRHTKLRALHYDYVITHSNDPRGIDIAMLYQQGGFRPIAVNTINWAKRIGLDSLRTRDMLHVKGITRTGDTLDIIAQHAPSRLGGKEAQVRRTLISLSLRQYCDSLCATNPRAKIVITGDFNDSPQSNSMRQYLGANPVKSYASKPQPANALFNLASSPQTERSIKASYRYRGNWEMLDQGIVNANLLDKKTGLYATDHSLRVVGHRFLLVTDDTYGGLKPFRTFQGPIYKGGFSDHLPIVIELYSHAAE